ncbi:MAG: ABC transporter substrate-binding protein [Chloroflexi bacterium]|nr:MAG: ABC transporter substrate-binding protein [Chloroflexota bacterium]TMF96076.1 MAG: ABC transporter substrate-binding protein [Chloroflexota bacterium]
MRRVAVGLFWLFLLSACGGGGGGGGQAGGTPQKGGTATIALESELRTLDPLDSSLLVEREVFYNMYDSLFTIDPSLKIKAGLVKSWDISDPQNYKFTLQDGVKFHDGTPFNGASVKANIERFKTAANSRRKSDLASVKSVEVTDDTHVIFHLAKPDATLLATLVDRAGMMLSMDAVAKGGQNFSLAPTGAGSGPFEFVEWKRNDHLTLKKNPSYWKSGVPYLDGVTYRAIPDVNAILSALKTGDIDIARVIGSKDVASIKADSNFVYRDTPAIGFNGFELNTGAPPFNDAAKRKAVATAVDRYAILKNIQFNIGVVGYGPIPPSSWAFDASEKIYDHADAAKAKSIATGFSFTYKTTSDPVAQQLAQLLQSELAAAGITMKIQSEEFATLVQECEAHQFEACGVNWSGRIDPDGNTYAWWHTGGSFNDSQYSNSQVDAWLEDARVNSDQAKRRQDYQNAQKQIVADAPYVFTFFGVSPQISNTKIHAFTLYPDLMIRMAEVWKG